MFGSQVMNQSTENGSMPLGGEQPRTPRYSFAKRSWLRLVSDSSTCNRAPRLIMALASRISSASCDTLFVAMACHYELNKQHRAKQHQANCSTGCLASKIVACACCNAPPSTSWVSADNKL